MRKILSVFLFFILIFNTFGCSGKKEVDFPFGDLVFEFGEQNIDGENVLSFSYKNNTEYTIIRLAVTYVPKQDITEEQREVLSACTGGKIDIYDLSVSAYNLNCVTSGGTSGVTPCDLINFCECESHGLYSDVMTPQLVTVTYLDGDDAYGVYYNYKRNEYDELDELNRDRYEWSDGKAASYLEKPECVSTEILFEDDKKFSFAACGTSMEVFEKYVADLESKGFVRELAEEDDEGITYDMLNGEGVKIQLKYKNESCYGSPEYMFCGVTLP